MAAIPALVRLNQARLRQYSRGECITAASDWLNSTLALEVPQNRGHARANHGRV
jgi:hypothetical protein